MTKKGWGNPPVWVLLFSVLFLACSSDPVPAAPAPALAIPPDELDAAVRETSDYLNKQLPKGNKLVILNIQSGFPALSEYIIDELIANTVNDRVFSVVDRQQLDTIRAELDFHMSGEVSEETAQSIGQMAGAQIIVSGAVSKIGDLYRLRIRALSVQSAKIEGQFNRNIPDGSTIAALVKSQATGYGGGTAPARTQQGAASSPAAPAGTVAAAKPGAAPAGQAAPPPASVPAASASSSAATPAPASAPAATPAPAPKPAPPPAVELFAGNASQGAMGSLYDALDWLAVNTQSGGNYTIVLGKDQAITPTDFNYDRKTVTITLKSAGGNRTVRFEGNSPAYSLFTVNTGVTFVLEDGVTLQGAQDNAPSLVRVNGGRFIMNGGILTGNKSSGYGGGVQVDAPMILSREKF
jgi:hypothetical protein